jgi:hypothetical protein
LPEPTPDPDHDLERLRTRRTEQRHRHSRALATLMEEREDLAGVHALADVVSDSLRWSA